MFGFDLGHREHVRHGEAQKFRGRLKNFCALIDLFDTDAHALPRRLKHSGSRIPEEVCKILTFVPNFVNHRENGIQRVSHFVRHKCIHQFLEFAFTDELGVSDLAGDVNDL